MNALDKARRVIRCSLRAWSPVARTLAGPVRPPRPRCSARGRPRAACPRAARSAGSARRRSTAATMFPGDRIGTRSPLLPSSITPRMPQTAVVMIGRPLIIASISVSGVPSKRLGRRYRSRAARAAAVSLSLAVPDAWTRPRTDGKVGTHRFLGQAGSEHGEREVGVTGRQQGEGRDHVLDSLVLPPRAGEHQPVASRVVTALRRVRVHGVGTREDAGNARCGNPESRLQERAVLFVQAEHMVRVAQAHVRLPEAGQRVDEAGSEARSLATQSPFFERQFPRASLNPVSRNHDHGPVQPGAPSRDRRRAGLVDIDDIEGPARRRRRADPGAHRPWKVEPATPSPGRAGRPRRRNTPPRARRASPARRISSVIRDIPPGRPHITLWATRIRIGRHRHPGSEKRAVSSSMCLATVNRAATDRTPARKRATYGCAHCHIGFSPLCVCHRV